MKKQLKHLLFDALLATFLFPFVLLGWLMLTGKQLTKQGSLSLLFTLWLLSAAGLVWWSLVNETTEPVRHRLGFWSVILVLILVVLALCWPPISG